MRAQLSGAPSAGELRGPQAPAKYETFTAPSVRITKEMIPTIFNIAGLAVASRLAWLDGRQELLKPFLGEVLVAGVDSGTRKRLLAYANALPQSKISLEHLMSSGPYVIAQLKFSGRQSRILVSYAPSNRVIELEILTIARISKDKVETARSYLRESVFNQQLTK